jgi:OmpA-OmpF porin, OOP family
MNKTKLFFISLLFLLIGTTFGQESTSNKDWLAKDSWAFGFGFNEPQLVSTNLYVNGWRGYGVYASIQRNFSEHLGLRFLANYGMLEGWVTPGGIMIKNHFFSGSADLLYYLLPWEGVSPYIVFGLGDVLYKVRNSPDISSGTNFDYIVNTGIGVEWSVAANWKITTEVDFHQVGTAKFDGFWGTEGGGLLGGRTDSYLTLGLGANFYFGKGERSKLPDLYNGIIGNQTDYAKIEEIVKKYQTQPTEVDYNKIAEITKNNAPVGSAVEGKWVLFGVNFDFNKATIRPESTPVLIHAAEILLTHPDLKVEIQGFTDSVGTEKYNLKLAKERADAVRDFMVAKGVDAGKLTTVGIGEANPVAPNKTENGRWLNRRIEFKVQ